MIGLGTTAAISILLLVSTDGVERSHLRRLRSSAAASVRTKQETSEFLWHELYDENDAMWRNLEESMSMEVCLDPSTPACVDEPFDLDGSADIGAVQQAGESSRCGSYFITVKGNGRVGCDAEDSDGSCPDALHFAYKKIAGNFRIQSKVCKPGRSTRGINGRSGLMIRDSLDPGAKHVFNAYTPNAVSINPSSRTEVNGPVTVSDISTPDLYCRWLTMERIGNEITTNATETDADFIPEGEDRPIGPEDCQIPDPTEAGSFHSQTVTIDMPDEVLVGLTVTSYNDDPGPGKDPNNVGLTEMNFWHIEVTPL